jgi:ABC-type cobalamin/Fe3+-siderophores transport system ATPase subunit
MEMTKGGPMRLIAENLAGERGGETIFANVEFALEDGEALIVTGPNGSGKSSKAACASRAAARNGPPPRQPATISATSTP